MAVFAIADTHLSFGVNKPMEIFQGWKDFEKRLENNWRHLVSEDDTVIIAGDISWGMTLDEARADFAFLTPYPAKKSLLRATTIFGGPPKARWKPSLKKTDLKNTVLKIRAAR